MLCANNSWSCTWSDIWTHHPLIQLES
jgi:hypothetical protein